MCDCQPFYNGYFVTITFIFCNISGPDSVATQIYFSDRDRVGSRPGRPKKIFFLKREYLIKTHKELNMLNVSDIDTEIFDLKPNIRDNRPDI